MIFIFINFNPRSANKCVQISELNYPNFCSGWRLQDFWAPTLQSFTLRIKCTLVLLYKKYYFNVEVKMLVDLLLKHILTSVTKKKKQILHC